MGIYWGDRGHCPKCGRFCGKLVGHTTAHGLDGVYGTCKTHGTVDLTNQEWNWDDFFTEEAADQTAWQAWPP